MKIFISWSGARSLTVAAALKEWLPLVVQGCQPWLSTEDVRKGTRWQAEIAEALSGASAGILCLSRDNLSSDWLLFEAGAISKALAGSPTLVCTYLIDLTSAEVAPPLGMFQATLATRDETMKLVRTLNDAMATPVPLDRLGKLFDRFWSDLETIVATVQNQTSVPAKRRDTYEMLEEILDGVRSVARVVSETATTWETRAWNAYLRNLPEPSVQLTHEGKVLGELRRLYDEIQLRESVEKFRKMRNQLRTPEQASTSDEGA